MARGGSLAEAEALTLFLVATARAEERENLADFGAQYAEYMRRSKRFVPFVF